MNTLTAFILVASLLPSTLLGQASIHAHSTKQPHALDGSTLWTHAAGSAKRNTTPSLNAAPDLTSFAWQSPSHLTVPQTGLVIDEHHVYALTRNPSNPTIASAVALDRFTGDEIWSTPIAPPILDSWSTPTIDIPSNTLLIAMGNQLVALDSSTGDNRWTTTLSAIVVNASPVVTDDLNNRDRAFITTYSFGFGDPAQLVCINIDPFDAITNPFQPGDIVWSLPLNADSSGNSPAYQSGRIYLATASDGSTQRGTVRCYDITTDTAPSDPLWSFTNTINSGYFGGVAIAQGHIYASSYSFSGLQTSANTVKLNKNTGDLAWSVDTNRTDATPIVLPNGDVVVSTGVATGAFDFLPFFGSLPSIQYIEDQGTAASLLWDSALATHDDLNSNNIWDFGEPFLSLGGWTHQPIAFQINNTPHLLVGTLAQTQPGVNIAHNTDLRIVDLSLHPTEPGFITTHTSSTGDTPALASGWVYTAGSTGIRAYRPSPSPMAVKSLINRYTSGELTLHQLMERLPR